MAFSFAVDEYLPNGARILSAWRGDETDWVVLAKWRKGGTSEWIVWRCNEVGHASNGHYFLADVGGIQAAVAKFAETVDRLREMYKPSCIG